MHLWLFDKDEEKNNFANFTPVSEAPFNEIDIAKLLCKLLG